MLSVDFDRGEPLDDGSIFDPKNLEREKRSRHRSRGSQSHQGSAHRARLRFQLCKESGQRADASGLEIFKRIHGSGLASPGTTGKSHDSPDGAGQCAPLTPTDAVFFQRNFSKLRRIALSDPFTAPTKIVRLSNLPIKPESKCKVPDPN